ncbi:hypothetical protein [Anaerocolumna xylanovorans]|uniref:Uncharacterized protein n=1 Tax=Anaerocolumna xylanovorans DSM 12503 TaxID=1121345 RepID=A0A1M7YJA8_9FIRM|nr:hypothetical protein [Anaerocolumna xylanovorans]SHO52707.1 hypothetical protein SAMN02745217_03790 [Anaerocolumna xylanovorans DSM 12503]
MCWSKKNRSVYGILAFIFCMVLFLAELSIPGMYSDSALPSSVSADNISADVLSETSPHNKKADVMAEVSENVGVEASADISSLTANTLSLKVLSLKYIYLKTILLYIPLILWTALTVLLKGGYISRMYLILFIHNSDGEKGKAASI